MSPWKVSSRFKGKPCAWNAKFGELTLSLHWRLVGAGGWFLYMLPSPPFAGWVSGDDNHPEVPCFNPPLKRNQVSAAQKAAEKFGAEWLMMGAEAYSSLSGEKR